MPMPKMKPATITKCTEDVFLAESGAFWVKAQRIGDLVYLDIAGQRVALEGKNVKRFAEWLRDAGFEDVEQSKNRD